ncbi:aconitate hydratase [Opitutus sp. GAS368]|uniref:aconitate hydratase n=1 Tax=Opitutus sp. GAS368 TaxID=1882749 RepID=UPI00087B6D19|nr:aconitate hydratase [Opitutus sp. GAS368]SDR65439.1 aconitase [Opitutus sp. GAS368]
MSLPNPFNTLQSFEGGKKFYSLPELARQFPGVARLPVSIRLVLEAVLRNCDGKRVMESNIKELANWKPTEARTAEIPFVVARIVLQDFTGVPLLVDLAAMRSAVAKLGKNPKIIEPLVPVDLVVDHSVQVDFSGNAEALAKNLDLEFKRNRERYQFLKWGMQAFDTFKVVPPGIGIVHQVNLEYLAKGVLSQGGVYYPDTLVGTDSHTTMINGIGIVGWGVGGIEAEAGMLGQPVYFLTPDVVGVHLTGALREGVTATDLALTVTQLMRKAKVVGKFVEFFGPGAAALPVVDRATIANMAPEYGATMGFFPIDAECSTYLRATGRDDQHIATYEAYYKAQGLWGIPAKGAIDYSQVVDLDLATVVPSVAGPKRPQDRIELPNLKKEFTTAFSKPVTENGFGKNAGDLATKTHVAAAGSFHGGGGGSQEPVSGARAAACATNPLTEHEMTNNRPTPDKVTGAAPTMEGDIGHGSVLIAAITSCTNTSNPSVMLAAGLLAKKAVEKGLTVNPVVKSSLAPGSRVVTDYLNKTGLTPYLDKLGFQTVGYGCTTCIGNSGPLHPAIEEAIVKNDLVAASVLSGNRNFEARVHQNIKANFLMSPPLVVAFALAGRVDIDMTKDPIGKDKAGVDVYLKDLWPTLKEVRDQMAAALKPEVFRRLYTDFAAQNPKWNEIPSTTGNVYAFDAKSTYIQEPPFFTGFSLTPGSIQPINGARALGIFGDSVTTDHISPAGAIKKSSPAGKYLLDNGVTFEDFNSYGSRRGNDRVMTRGTFANVRIKNLMLGGKEGGNTLGPDGAETSIYDASMAYQKAGVPLIVLAGQEYGTGSSRDWAAKGTNLLGVKVVVAQSFERIHRSNLVGMGVLPLQFKEGTTAQTLKLDGSETYDVVGLTGAIKPQQDLTLKITRKGGAVENVPVRCRIDTPIEIDYYQHGGILPYVLRQIVAKS